MIQHVDADDFSGFGQPIGDSNIFAAGRGVARRVIVSQNDRRRGVFDRGAENFTRMDKTRIQRSDGDLVRIDDLVFCVQRNDVKLFMLRVGDQAAKVALAELNRISTAGYFGWRFQILAGRDSPT